jgi:imidazolonepropionase-like amidohydrolase
MHRFVCPRAASWQRLLRTLAGCVAATALLVHMACAQSNNAVAYVGATLIDGTGGAPISDSAVLVEGDRISVAGPRSSISIPRNARVVSVTGKWIVPGLIDAHVHFFESGLLDEKYASTGSADVLHQRALTYDRQARHIRARAAYTLSRYLCAGVTSAISYGGPEFEWEVKHLATLGQVPAPNVFTSTGFLSPLPSATVFQDFLGSPSLATVPTPADATAAVRAAAARGADIVKIGYLGVPGSAEAQILPILAATVDQAHALGLRVTAHIFGPTEMIRRFVEAGLDDLAHTPTSPIDATTLELMRKRNMIVVSTLLVLQRPLDAARGEVRPTRAEKQCGDPEIISVLTHRRAAGATPFDELYGPESVARAAENLKLLRRSGIPVAIGTDAGSEGLLHGASMHAELAALADLGFSPMELIVAATLTGARSAGKEQLIGSVTNGKLADFLILTADPLADIGNLNSIETVVHKGHAFDRRRFLPSNSK